MYLDFGIVLRNLPFLLSGLWVTILISLLTMVIAVAIGLVVALARLYGGRVLRRPCEIYVDVIRSVPLLTVVMWTYYALPVLINRQISPFTGGLIALSIHAGAYISEVFRAGLASIAAGQEEAALGLGMSRLQAFRRIIVPQALVRMLPPIGSELVVVVKASALVSAIAVPELLYRGATLNSVTLRPFEVFAVVGVIYFLVTYPLARGSEYLFKRLSPPAAQ